MRGVPNNFATGSCVNRFLRAHGSVAVCDFSLDHARAEFALRGVVGDVDLAGIIAKGQKLVSRAPDFGLQFPGEVASGWRGEKFRSVPMSAEFGLICRETPQKGDVRAPTKSRSRR